MGVCRAYGTHYSVKHGKVHQQFSERVIRASSGDNTDHFYRMVYRDGIQQLYPCKGPLISCDYRCGNLVYSQCWDYSGEQSLTSGPIAQVVFKKMRLKLVMQHQTFRLQATYSKVPYLELAEVLLVVWSNSRGILIAKASHLRCSSSTQILMGSYGRRWVSQSRLYRWYL